MLSVVLYPESEQYLVEILAQEKTTSSELIKLLGISNEQDARTTGLLIL
ncbi:MAG: hypothetical protein RIG27_30295 [Coleofasciculus sp. F4-SAH-05]